MKIAKSDYRIVLLSGSERRHQFLHSSNNKYTVCSFTCSIYVDVCFRGGPPVGVRPWPVNSHGVKCCCAVLLFMFFFTVIRDAEDVSSDCIYSNLAPGLSWWQWHWSHQPS